MKKWIWLVLTMLMIFALCACGTGETAGETGGAEETQPPAVMGEGLNIGYAKVDITPDYSVGISGYSDSETRISEGVEERIYATCIAATEDTETILIFTVDSIGMSNNEAEYFRTLITASTGIPGNKIFIGATHSHSCPLKSGQYKTDLSGWMTEAAVKALEDRSPATVLAATAECEGMNFVRHYEMEDGTYAGSNFGDFSKGIVGHAADSDPQMVLVKFDRGERTSVLMVNWQAHPDSAREIGYYSLAASWVGPLRDELEKSSGMHVAYFTGASGNQNKDSKITAEKHNLGWREYGKKMGELANEALSELKTIEGSGIRTSREMFPAQIDHSWDHMLSQAEEVYELWKTQGKSAGDALGKLYGFTSSYQARAICTRADMGKAQNLEINAFSIGGIGFTTGTYEMFSEQGLYVKENSPFEITFIITGNSGYIPSAQAYTYRSYEADTGYYVAGTAEELANAYVSLLGEVK